MYFPDLVPYTYVNREPDSNLLTVGWLDGEHSFPKGKISDELLHKILVLCFRPENTTRGFHDSPFLPIDSEGYIVEYNSQKLRLGSAEIRVTVPDGKSYASPNLIYHYIKDCAYLPPKEFLQALDSMGELE